MRRNANEIAPSHRDKNSCDKLAHWTTFWADQVDIIRLQEVGGWSSLTMPRRYVEESEIANEGMA
jgi:hypothetical protein